MSKITKSEIEKKLHTFIELNILKDYPDMDPLIAYDFISKAFLSGVIKGSESEDILSWYNNIFKKNLFILDQNDYSEASMPAISVGRALGIPIIQHLHSLIDESYPKDLIANFKNLRHFVCVSVAVKESLDLALGYESKAQVLPNAIPFISISDSDAGRTKNHILMVGRCVPSKGFDVGIRLL